MSLTQKKSRREHVWEACEHIAEGGVKPTLRLVRERYPHGSPNDVQKDINDWFAKMWEERAAAKSHPALPSPVADAANALWKLAMESAHASLDSLRGEVAAQVQTAQQEVAAARGDAEAARQEKTAVDHLLALANTNIDHLGENIKSIEHRLMEESALRHAADETITQLRATMAQQAQEHAQRISEFQGQMSLAEERYEAMNKRSLMEIEHARAQATSIKEDFTQRLSDAELRERMLRGKLQEAESKLAAASGRAEELSAQIASCQSANQAITESHIEAERLASERLGMINSLNDRVSAYQENETRLLAQIKRQAQPRKSSQKSKETTQ